MQVNGCGRLGTTIEMFLVGIIAAAGLIPAGCSKSAPKCDSGKVVDAVIQTVSQDIRKDYNFVAGMGAGELSEEEWRMMRAGMVITVDSIREQSYNKDTDKRVCAGNLLIQSSASKETIPITYSPDPASSDPVRVELSGYREYKDKSMPALAPNEDQ